MVWSGTGEFATSLGWTIPGETETQSMDTEFPIKSFMSNAMERMPLGRKPVFCRLGWVGYLFRA